MKLTLTHVAMMQDGSTKLRKEQLDVSSPVTFGEPIQIGSHLCTRFADRGGHWAESPATIRGMLKETTE